MQKAQKNKFVVEKVVLIEILLLVILITGVMLLERTCNTFVCKFNKMSQSTVQIWFEYTATDGSGKKGKVFGSGTFIDKHYVLTAHHVVEGVQQVNIHTTTQDCLGIPMYNLPKYDTAVVYVPNCEGVPVRLGDSHRALVGTEVYIIASPLGIFNVFSSGYITGIEKTDESSFLVTNSNLIFGSSGGALFNMQNELIGIVDAINSVASYMGYAIPINDVKPMVLSAIRQHKREMYAK